MKTQFSKIALGLGAASMFLAGSAFSHESIDDRLDTLEKEMKEVAARNPESTYGAAFTTARPETKNTRWFVFADVIYWHPKMGGTEYAITYTPTDFIGNILPTNTPLDAYALSHRPNGDYKENDFGWDLGLKAGLGYKTPHDAWDVLGRYTWFESHDTKQSGKNYPAMMFPLKLSIGLSPDFSAVNHAKSTVDISYQNVDLELSRNFFLSHNYSVKPYISLKGTWLDIQQKLLFTQVQNASLLNLFVAFRGDQFKANLSSRYFGFGPRIGAETKYYFNNGINIFGDFAAAILYGQFKTKQTDDIPEARFGGLLFDQLDPDEQQEFEELFNFSFTAPSRKLSHNFHSFIPFAQMWLGLEWNKFMNCKKQHIRLKAGYEVQYFWRANQIEEIGNKVNAFSLEVLNLEQNQITIKPRGRADNSHNSKDLMFYGITAEARLDF